MGIEPSSVRQPDGSYQVTLDGKTFAVHLTAGRTVASRAAHQADEKVEHRESAAMIDELADAKALGEQHAHEQGSVPIGEVLSIVAETKGLTREQRAAQIDLLQTVIAKATQGGKAESTVHDLSPGATRVERRCRSRARQGDLHRVDRRQRRDRFVEQDGKGEGAPPGPGDRCRSAQTAATQAGRESAEGVSRNDPDEEARRRALRRIDQPGRRVLRALQDDPRPRMWSRCRAKRASAAQLGMQEIRYSPNGKRLAPMLDEASTCSRTPSRTRMSARPTRRARTARRRRSRRERASARGRVREGMVRRCQDAAHVRRTALAWSPRTSRRRRAGSRRRSGPSATRSSCASTSRPSPRRPPTCTRSQRESRA